MIKKEKGEESGLAGRVKGASPRYTVSTFSPTPRILSVYLFFPLPSPYPPPLPGAGGQQWHEFARGGSAVIIFGREKISCWPPDPPFDRLIILSPKRMFARPLCPRLPVPLVFDFYVTYHPTLACLDLVKLNYRRLNLDKYAKGGRKEGKNKRNTFNFRDVKTTKIGSKES